MVFVNLGVKHFRDFMLKFSIDLNQRWQRDNMIQNGVWSYEFQHRDMEDGVDHSHGIGREGRHQNESPGGPKDNGTESERGAEWSVRGCDRVDQRWPGLMWVLESRAGDTLM